MREGLWKFACSWGPALLAGLALRLWMLNKLFQVTGDSLIYGELAKSLLHGHYSRMLVEGTTVPSMIRLPGYPFYLAVCFRLFGIDNYFAPVVVQIVLELLGCVLLADFAARVAPSRLAAGARGATLWLSALCPFTASFSVGPLAEPLTLFFLALAMWAMVRFADEPRWPSALCFTFAITYAALLRPDGALAAIAFAPALLAGVRRGRETTRIPVARLMRIATVCTLVALAPFVAWTWRNWSVFHVFQPLAPRLANDPGENPNIGWEHWVKTWCLDWSSTYDVYWNVPDDTLDISKLPNRAFDSPAQYVETAQVAAEYNSHNYKLTPAIDARFEHLAQERISANPLRYYVWLPLGRVADMWLRPRVENLDIDPDWWVYARHHAETRFSFFYAGLNLSYLVLAGIGILLRPRFWKALLAYMLLRSALLLTVEAPETRYTIECFPMLFVLAGIGLYWVIVRVCLSVLKVKASDGNG
jgi:Na+-transporting methylmalonyl-CoA/oxaloacetate decarboxylase gamma subunit